MTIHTLQNYIGAIPDHILNLAFRAEGKYRDIKQEDYQKELKFYQRSSFREEKKFFQLPTEAPALTENSVQTFHDGKSHLYSYPSRYQPHHPDVKKRFLSHQENQTGYLWLWQHDTPAANAKPRPLVFCVHGFRMGNPKRAMAMFKIEKLFQQGMDVALFIQPHHWKRSCSRYQQHFFNAEDVPLTIENVGQQIHDLHSCYLALSQMGYSKIGMIGGSLGGMAVALYATLSDQPAFIFSVVPAIRVDTHLDPKKARLPFSVDEQMRQDTFRALDLIDPSFYSPRFDLNRMAVVYHCGDKINDAMPTEAWTHLWKLPHVTALTGGHWIVFDGKARGRAWYEWLKTHQFLPS